jgi:hypothetical protein
MGAHIAETGNLGLEYADLTWELLPLRLRVEIAINRTGNSAGNVPFDAE